MRARAFIEQPDRRSATEPDAVPPLTSAEWREILHGIRFLVERAKRGTWRRDLAQYERAVHEGKRR